MLFKQHMSSVVIAIKTNKKKKIRKQSDRTINLPNKIEGFRCSFLMLYNMGNLTRTQKSSVISHEVTSSMLVLLTSAKKNQASLFLKIICLNLHSYSLYCICHTHKPIHSTTKILKLLLIKLL